MFTHVLLSLLFTSVSFAVPTSLNARDAASPSCNGLPGGSDVMHGFSIAAYNTSLPNANSTGAPIVIAETVQIHESSYGILSTWNSYPYNHSPTMELVNGTLLPTTTPNGAGFNVSGSKVSAGGQPQWIISKDDVPPSAQVWCAVPNGAGNGFPVLAVNGDTQSWSICAFPGALMSVVYKPSKDASNFDTCYPVQLQLVPLSL